MRGNWLQAKILKENKLKRIHLKDLTVLETPKSSWKVFPSQDIPSLFNYFIHQLNEGSKNLSD